MQIRGQMRKACAAAVATLLTLMLAPTSYADEAATPTRVLIVGDSVTQGYRGDYTWRYFLWRALEARGDAVDFVGRRTGTFNLGPDGTYDFDYQGADAYADPAFDRDHGATFGGWLREEGNWMYDPVGPQVSAHAADVVVSMWGINDLSLVDVGPADLIASYRLWVAEARAANPDVDLVVGRLPYDWLYDGEVVTFNAMLGEMAAELTTEQSRIAVATMLEPYTQAADSSDHLHPNTSGQRKIARMVGEALVGLLPHTTPGPVVVPTAPEVPQVPVPAQVAPPVQEVARVTPPRRVRAVRRDGRTRVAWRTARGGAEAYRVRCGGKRRTTTRTSLTLRSRARSCAVRSLDEAGPSEWRSTRVRVRRRAP
jgi:lysophospholipase L1-like esterase